MIDYDSFPRCHLTDIFFRFSRGSKRVNPNLGIGSSVVFLFITFEVHTALMTIFLKIAFCVLRKHDVSLPNGIADLTVKFFLFIFSGKPFPSVNYLHFLNFTQLILTVTATAALQPPFSVSLST